MKKKIFVVLVAVFSGLGITAAKAVATEPVSSPCNAEGCPHSGVACCTDASGNTFYKGDTAN